MTEVDRDTIMLLFAGIECGRALQNLNDVDQLAGVRVLRQPGVVVLENQRIFDRIRLGLQMAANVSRLFWPPRNFERGARLRTLTGLDQYHRLSDRTLRNHIEHLDERLDDWTEVTPRPFLAIELVLHDVSGVESRRSAVKNSTAIVYDVKSQSVQLFGDIFSLPDLRTDLEDVQTRISDALEPTDQL